MSKIKIGVIGSGTMGSGIAQLAAIAGHDVIIIDSNKLALDKSQAGLIDQINKLASKNKLTPSEAVAVNGRFYFSEKTSSVSECELIIEAIVEEYDAKKSLFTAIEKYVNPQCILASNTSSLSITALAANCVHPERVIGLHFFNPAFIMPLVEIIPGLQTNQEIAFKLKELMESWGKITVQAKDSPGFIVNRIARPYYSEALRIYEEGFADFATIDYAMTSEYGFKMGPFALMDFIGNDVNYAVTNSVWQSCFYEARYKPSMTQRNLVAAGWLGRKSGKGFYNYDAGIPEPILTDATLIKNIAWRILVMLINEAADALYYKLATREDIETAMLKGVNYPKGLLAWADEIGIIHCLETMQRLFDNYHEERYRSHGLRRLVSEA